MNAFYVSAILSLTVFLALAFGIAASYMLVNGILFAFGHHATAKAEPQPVLLARNAQAGAD